MWTVSLMLAVLLPASVLPAQKPALPDPPKKDVPFLIHADLLLQTEIGEAREETRKEEQLYTIPGQASPVKTPLASPEFLFAPEKIQPDRLQLFRLEPKNGHREVVVFRKKKPVARPIRVSVFRISGNLYKIRVDESLPPGEYSFSPEGVNTVFCFAVE
jgi:hypothetical protein